MRPGRVCALGRVHVICCRERDEISALDRSAFRLDRKVGAEHLDEAVLGLRLEDLAAIRARHLYTSRGALARPPARTPLLLRHSAQCRVDVGASAGPRELAAAVARRLPAHLQAAGPVERWAVAISNRLVTPFPQRRAARNIKTEHLTRPHTTKGGRRAHDVLTSPQPPNTLSWPR